MSTYRIPQLIHYGMAETRVLFETNDQLKITTLTENISL